MDIATILSFWEQIGVFDYLLPFLLIFGVVYGILEASRIISGNKGVNVVIAAVVGLLTLRVGYVQRFFIEAFPRLGVGIAILIILLVLTGLFIGPGKNMKVMFWIFIAIGLVIGVVVIAGSFDSFGWGGGYNWFESEAVYWILSAALLVGLIVAIVVGKTESKPWQKGMEAVRDLLGD